MIRYDNRGQYRSTSTININIIEFLNHTPRLTIGSPHKLAGAALYAILEWVYDRRTIPSISEKFLGTFRQHTQVDDS